jgi:probable HAF family extracellular repeat protein
VSAPNRTQNEDAEENKMKFKVGFPIITVILLAALESPVRLAAQEQKKLHHHYKLIDMGTLGGPQSYINPPFNSVPPLSRKGMVVGGSATSVPTSGISDFYVCGGPNGIPNVFHAFAWKVDLVTDLGALPPAEENCSDAGSVNARGEVSGVSEINDVDPILGIKELRAVLWKQDKIINLGTFGGPHSIAGIVGAINNRGEVVGAATNTIPDPFSLIYQLVLSPNGTQTRAFVWRGGAMQDLGTLGGPDAWAFFVNERGQIAGESYAGSTPNPVTGVPTLDPFLWQDGRMLDLGTLGGNSGSPEALNNRGQVIGYSNLAGDQTSDPFLWDQGKLIDLNTSTIGGSPFLVFGINDLGEIVGAASFPGNPFDAYIWRNGVATDLGHLSDCSSLAFAINSQGQVVGGTFSSCEGGTHSRAFLWEHGQMTDLNSVVPADSPLQLVEAEAINDRGEIAGNGVPKGVAPGDVNSLGHVFLLIPCDENHPSIEGCDYDLVEECATATVTSSTPFAQTSATTNAKLPDVPGPTMRSLHRRIMPWYRGLVE